MKFRGKLNRSVVVQKFSKVLHAKNEATAEHAESSSTMQSSDKDARCDSASLHRGNGPSSSQVREHPGEQDIEDKAVISTIHDSTISAPDQIDSQGPTPDETKSGGSRSSRDDVSQGLTPGDTKSHRSRSSRDDASTWYSRDDASTCYSRRTGGSSYTSDSSYYTESEDESVISPSFVLDAIHELDWYFDKSFDESEPTHLEVIESFSSYETGDSQSSCSSQSETDAIDQTSHKTDKSTSAKKQELLPEENSKCDNLVDGKRLHEESEDSIDKGETAATLNSSCQEAVSDQEYEVQYARPPAECNTSLSEEKKITDGAETNFSDEGKDASESQSGRRVENKNPTLQKKNSTSTASVAFEMTVLDHLQQKKIMDADNISHTSGLPELGGGEKPIEDGFEKELPPAKLVVGNGNNKVIDDGVEESLSTYLQWKTEAVATRDRNLRFTQRHEETAKKCSVALDGNVYGKWRNFLFSSKRSAEDRGQCQKGAATGSRPPSLRSTEKDTPSNELVRNKMELNADKTGPNMSSTKRNKTEYDAIKRDSRSSDMLRDRIAEQSKNPTILLQTNTEESYEEIAWCAPEIQDGTPRSDDREEIQGSENNQSVMIDNKSGASPMLDFWRKILGEDPEDIHRSMLPHDQSDSHKGSNNAQLEELQGSFFGFHLGSKRNSEDRGHYQKDVSTQSRPPSLRRTEKDAPSNHGCVANETGSTDKTGTTMSPTKRNKTVDDAIKRDARSSDMLRDRNAEKPKTPTTPVQSYTNESHEEIACRAPEIQVGPPRSDDREGIQENENKQSAMIDNSSGTSPMLDFWRKILGEDQDTHRSMSSNEQSDSPIRSANTQPEELQGSVFGSWLAPFTTSSVACEHCKKHFSFVDSKVEEYVGNPRSGVKSMFHTSCREERALFHREKRKALRQIALYGYLKRRRAPMMQPRKIKKLTKQKRHEQSKIPERVEKTNVLHRIFGRRTKNSLDKVQSNKEDSDKAEKKSLVPVEERKLVAFHESTKTTGHGKTSLQVHNLGSREIERRPLKPPTTRQRSLSPAKKKMEHQGREARIFARLTAPGHPRSPLRGQAALRMIKPKRSGTSNPVPQRRPGTLSPVPRRVMNEPSNPQNQKAPAKFNDRQLQSTHLGSASRPARRQEDVAVRRRFEDTGKGKSPKTMLASQERSSKTWGKPVDTTTTTPWTPARRSSRSLTDEKVWPCRKSPTVDQTGRGCTQQESYDNNNNNRHNRGAGPQTSAMRSSRFTPPRSPAMKESRDYNYLVDPEVAFRMVPTEKYLRLNPTQPMKKHR